jgi:hypothetical protein
MGVVFKAEDLESRRFVTPKFLTKSMARDPQDLERFRPESRAASSFDHSGNMRSLGRLKIQSLFRAKGELTMRTCSLSLIVVLLVLVDFPSPAQITPLPPRPPRWRNARRSGQHFYSIDAQLALQRHGQY